MSLTKSNPTWTKMPTTFGWHFFTPKLEDWDLAKPYQVERWGFDESNYTFKVQITPEIKALCADNLLPGNINENMGYWYGPIHIEKPTKMI